MHDQLLARARVAVVLDGDTGPGLAVTRSLGRAGWRVLVPRGSRSELSRYAAGSVEVPDAAREPDAFVHAVRRLAGGDEVDVVVPTTDASLSGAWEAVGEQARPRVVGGDRRTVEIALDKVACLRHAERHGFPVPGWSAPESATEARSALRDLGLPLVVKPRRSFLRRNGSLEHRRHQFVRTEDELEGALYRLGDGETLPVVQEYVPGRALSVSVVVRDGAVLAALARETFTFHPVPGGTSVWKRTISPDDAGVAEALELLRAVELDGVAEVEYQVGADGSPRLMEIGARLHGWVPLAIAAGVDLPRLAAAAVMGDAVEPVETYKIGVEMRWPAGELQRLRALAAPGHVLPPGMGRWDIARGVWPPWRPGMRYDGVDPGDLRPLFSLPRGRRGRS